MSRRGLRRAFVALLCAGCAEPTIGGPCEVFTGSISAGEACKQQLYFPVGLAIDPDADALYVSNGNADLRYAHGTVMALDLARFECALELTRAGPPAAPPDACKDFPALVCQLRFAGSDYQDRSGCSAADAANLDAIFFSANRDRIGHRGLCRPDLLDPSIIECDEQMLADGVLVGNFAGEVRVRGGQPALPSSDPASGTPGPCTGSQRRYLGPGGIPLCLDPDPPSGTTPAANRRLFVAVRGDPSITWIDVRRSQDPLHRLALDCGTPPGDLPADCSNQRVTVRDFVNLPDAPGAQCFGDKNQCVPIPGEPFGLALDQGYLTNACSDRAACRPGQTCSDGKLCPIQAPYQRLLVSHLAGGEVTLIDASVDRPTSVSGGVKPDRPVVLDVRSGFFAANGAGLRGAFSLAPQVPGDGRSLWYLTSRVNPTIALFRIANANTIGILNAGTFQLSQAGGGPYATGDDVRGLVFDPCSADNPGCRAFVIDNHPPSLFTLDTRVDPQGMGAGFPRNQVIDIANVCQGPSHLEFRRLPDLPGGTVQNRVYVLCYDASAMDVIDPDLARLVDVVPVGRGPNSIAFNFGPGIATAGNGPPPGQPPRAFISNFLDMTVSVVDLIPGSPTENHVIARIGFTEPPVAM